MAWRSAAGEDAGLGSSTTVGNCIVAFTQKMELGGSPRELRLTPSRLLNTSTPQNMQRTTAVGHNETSLARCSLTVGTRLFIHPAANPGHLRGTQYIVLLMLPAFYAPLLCGRMYVYWVHRTPTGTYMGCFSAARSDSRKGTRRSSIRWRTVVCCGGASPVFTSLPNIRCKAWAAWTLNMTTYMKPCLKTHMDWSVPGPWWHVYVFRSECETSSLWQLVRQQLCPG